MNVLNPLNDCTWTVHTVIAITITITGMCTCTCTCTVSISSTAIVGVGGSGEIETVLKGIFKCGSTPFPSSVALYRNVSVSWHIVVIVVGIGMNVGIGISISISIVWTGDRDWMNRVRSHVRIGMIVPNLISV